MKADQFLAAAAEFDTPLYVYDLNVAQERLMLLKSLFVGRFGVSYAIKANPNPAVLAALSPGLSTFDASSGAEVRRAQAAGMPPGRITFSGPAKRRFEIELAIDAAVGEMVIESLDEARMTSEMAIEKGTVQPVLVRINPLRVPRGFGASMAGTPSQFGIDEEDIATALPEISALPGLALKGFHIYSGSNCRDAYVIAENFKIFAGIFRAAQEATGIFPERLVFGSGFGIPYLPGETPLDHTLLPDLLNPIVDEIKSHPSFSKTECNLEIGRWLVGPAGWLLTRVISTKRSRGVEIRTCDAGFNNHLAACGMMGSVIRRNWVVENVTNPRGVPQKYTLTGPLCTSIDRLAMDIELPEVRVGDVLALPMSGAYGFSASPSRFISHPEPREVVFENSVVREATDIPIDRARGERDLREMGQ